MEFQSLIKDREQVAYTFFAISTSWKTHLEIVPWSQNHFMRCSSWNMAFIFQILTENLCALQQCQTLRGVQNHCPYTLFLVMPQHNIHNCCINKWKKIAIHLCIWKHISRCCAVQTQPQLFSQLLDVFEKFRNEKIQRPRPDL